MTNDPTPLTLGPGISKIGTDWDNPALLSNVIISRPLRGNGTENNPYYRAIRLTLTDGTFICEIQPHANQKESVLQPKLEKPS